MDLGLKLKTPINAHGQQLEELNFTEPTGQLVVQLGEPYFHMAGGGFRELPDVTVSYIVRLAKIPRSAAEGMAPGDRKAFFAKILPFLLPSGELEGASD